MFIKMSLLVPRYIIVLRFLRICEGSLQEEPLTAQESKLQE